MRSPSSQITLNEPIYLRLKGFCNDTHLTYSTAIEVLLDKHIGDLKDIIHKDPPAHKLNYGNHRKPHSEITKEKISESLKISYAIRRLFKADMVKE